jgi:hypothetical protein
MKTSLLCLAVAIVATAAALAVASPTLPAGESIPAVSRVQQQVPRDDHHPAG